MGIKELVLLTVAQQTLQALAAVAAHAGPVATSAFGRAAWPVVAQWAANGATMAGWGLTAAAMEFTALQNLQTTEIAAEAGISTQLPSLPPIT
jgi:hypothetical protein